LRANGEAGENVSFIFEFPKAKEVAYSVMAGLVPAIHVFIAATLLRRGCPAKGRA
jgi:hypothetical protein